MISFLRGIVAAKGVSQAVLDVQGVGYALTMSANALAQLPDIGQEITVQTMLVVNDAGVTLYGFADGAERSLFQRLIGVSGIGPKVALSALSSYSPQELVRAITAQDVSRIAKVPGIGKKTAQRMILELQGSLASIEAEFGGLTGEGAVSASGAAGVLGQPAAVEAVYDALLGMGFTSHEAELALNGAPGGASEAALLQYALKKLGS